MSPRTPLSNRELIDAVRRSGVTSPNPSTRQRRLEAVLRAAASVTTRPPDRSTVRLRWPFTLRLVPTMITSLIVAIVLATGVSTAVASDNAKPGDPLFGFDKALERLQRSLTFTDMGRAEVEASIAEEREAEREALERAKAPAAVNANVEADHALEQAQTTVETVRVKLETKGNERAVESLRRVEEKLRVLETRHEERREEERERTETKGDSEEVEDDDSNENTNVNAGSDERGSGDVKGAETEKERDEEDRRSD